MNSKLFLLSAVAGVLAADPSYPQNSDSQGPPEPIDVEMFYQYSATDNDAEVTIDVESGIAIDHLTALAPDGHTVVIVQSHDRLGLREIEVESDEPSVEEVQRAYPEGNYLFSSQAVNGARMVGRVKLSHDVVAAPDFFNFGPCNEQVDPTAPVTIVWNTVVGADGGYEIVIEQDDTGANLRITRGAESTNLVIPDGFLEPGLEYEIEMKSVTAGGNKTSASCEFSTQPRPSAGRRS
jgi:hypothetical protein